MNSGIITPGALVLSINPLQHQPGDMIQCLNVANDQFGSKKKRNGYILYLGTPDNTQVNTLMNWRLNNGTQFWNYRASGGTLYYSQQGTGAWTICGNGTLTAGTPVVNAVLENTMLVSQDAGTTRHTTSGTSFTDTSAAPAAVAMVDYQNRIYAAGTSSSLFWSNVGTPSDWTNDSSSINIPGPGRLNVAMKVADRLITSKNSGVQHRWDGFSLVDISTNLGPTSFKSMGSVEDYRFYLNRLGIYGHGGIRPEIVSNAVEKQIYNDAEEGIAGTVFENAPGAVHQYQYHVGIGTVTDDLTDETIADCILVNDFQTEEWTNWKFANRPYSFLSFRDNTDVQQFIFGDNSGQCYQLAGTATTDNGAAIEVVMQGIIHMNTLLDKKWNWYRAAFNPGCEAHIQVAVSNAFTKGKKNWMDLGDATNGVVEYRFPSDSRGKFLYWRITEASRFARFHFYGFEYDADIIIK